MALLPKLRARLVVVAAVALAVSQLVLPVESLAQRSRRPRRVSQPRPPVARVNASAAQQDARVAQIADEYLRGYFAFYPSEATALGVHEFDNVLEARDADALAREVRRLHGTLSALARVAETRLSPEARYDYLVLQSHARAELLELEDVRMWQRNPNVYNRLLASGVDNILKRNYAPIAARLDALVARERQIARLLSDARVNLQNPPRIYTETAIAQVGGSIDYFSTVVPQMFERAGGGRLPAARRAEFETTNEGVVRALTAFREWLRIDLLPRSNGDYAIGAENFRRKLLYEEMVETPLAVLIREGERELRRTQNEMRAVAEEVAPGRDLMNVIRTLGREHPAADGLVGETRAELNRIRAFVRTQQILTPPASENLQVAETPEYARSTSFASMDTPGAFERVATEAYYYVTPPDPAWDARRKEEHLSFYNRYSLPIVSIHEVYPGHYYQLLAARRSPSRVRAALGSGSFIEGWAHYTEQMMLDEGFGGNNPKLKLAQLQAALSRLCRYLVGLKLHTQGMTYEGGVEFFMREGYMERANAEREARRGTLDPTYLVYTLGKMEILKLREEYRARAGASFRLGEFHDRLLAYGSPPVKILRMALLGDANAPSNSTSASDDEDRTNVVEFSVLATGALSGHEGGRMVELITNENDWRRAWAIVGGGRPQPEINFNSRASIVVYQGQKPAGGYSVEIAEIRRDGTVLAVKVKERRPAFGDVTTQVITSPFVVVSIPRPPQGASVRLTDEGQGVAEPETQQNRKIIVRPRGRRGRGRKG
ncbi:MAG: hypothetical protein QOD32_2603 [Pyrinomonadaceae bacterium]|nr:hypothetical protein [Pyrinomonadaceae bacterium]